MKKKIKLILSKFNLLLYFNYIFVFFDNKKSTHHSLNQFLISIIKLFNNNNIKLIPFFGTLLGIYREGGVIAHDNDIDFAIIKNNKSHEIINFLINNNFTKVLDCYIQDTKELILEKYKYKNFEIDIFYIYEEDNFYYFYDNESNSGLSTIEEISNNIIVYPYINRISKFEIDHIHVNKFNFFGSNNTKLLLSELYGDNFINPDKYWRQSKRKNRKKTNYKLIINEY